MEREEKPMRSRVVYGARKIEVVQLKLAASCLHRLLFTVRLIFYIPYRAVVFGHLSYQITVGCAILNAGFYPSCSYQASLNFHLE